MRQANGLDEEIGCGLRVQEHSEATVVPPHGTWQAEEVTCEPNEMFEAFLIGGRQTKMTLDAADVSVPNEVTEEGTEIWIHFIRNRDGCAARGQGFARRLVLLGVIKGESRRQSF